MVTYQGIDVDRIVTTSSGSFLKGSIFELKKPELIEEMHSQTTSWHIYMDNIAFLSDVVLYYMAAKFV